MFRQFRRKLNRAALMLLILLLCSVPALAAPMGSLQLILQDSDGQPVADVQVELIRVAGMDGEGCRLREGFEGLGVSGDTLYTEPTPENAELVYQYVCANDLKGIVKTTSAAGTVSFNGLGEGVYLLFERGGQEVAFEPFLVVMPTRIDGEPAYHLVSIPKISETEVRTVSCFKLWEDNLDAAGKRPNYIEVTLLRDGVPFRTATLSAVNGWQHQFHMLPKDGTYTVKESSVSGYQAEYLTIPDGFVIVNRYNGGGGGGDDSGEAHVSVTKVWEDDDNAAGKRPDSITVQLIEDGTVVKTAVLGAANGWKHTFTGLDADKSYTVKEIAVSEYTASYSGNAAKGIVITNTLDASEDPGIPPGPVVPDPGKVNIPVRVEWIDQDDAAGKRPDSVIVYLIADGNIVAWLELGPECNWEGVYTNVDADLSYTVWQPAVSEYTTTYSGNASVGFVVTNVYTEDVTDPGVPLEPTLPISPPEEPELPEPELPEPELPEPGKDPEDPLKPTIPQTGMEVLPAYLLMGVGVLLVLLGLVDLCRGRECYEEED